MSDLEKYACQDESVERMRPLFDDNIDIEIRGAFARDRDRILYCKAFRRLANKTQVYFSGSGNEHMHTRLTHTLEVAHIAKSIAKALKLNLDLVEAITFGHDVGHSPFGHAGEAELDNFLKGGLFVPSALRRCMKANSDPLMQAYDGDKPVLGRSGFQHNFQSVRLLSFLENYDPTEGDVEHGIFEDGLNLSLQTLSGVLHHTNIKIKKNILTDQYYPDTTYRLFEKLTTDTNCANTVEGQVVAVADEIAQLVHDFHDAIEKGIYSVHDFLKLKQVKEILDETWSQSRWKVSKEFFEKLREHEGRSSIRYSDKRKLTEQSSRSLIAGQLCSLLMGYFVRDAISGFRKGLVKYQGEDTMPMLIPGLKPTVPGFAELKAIKNDTVINNHAVNRMDNKGKFIIRRLIKAYLTDPRQLPDSCLSRYMLMKHRQQRDGSERFIEWIRQVSGYLDPAFKMGDKDLENIIKAVEEEEGGRNFRTITRRLMDKLCPHMLFDEDYLRTIVDHVASMTDKYAEAEVAKLYF